MSEIVTAPVLDSYLSEVLRGASLETITAITEANTILERAITDNSNKLCYCQDILTDTASGGNDIITHHPRDIRTLAETLVSSSPPLKFGAIVCPDYGGHKENGVWVYNMNTLGSGIPQTAFTTHSYLEVLSKRAKKWQQPTEVVIQLPGWELTRSDYLANINGGISSQEALELLQGSVEKTRTWFSELKHDCFNIRIGTQLPEGFHQEAASLAQELLETADRRIAAVHEGRREFHNNQFTREMAALELAESALGWETLQKENPDIIITSTSPTIARACLSGREPFILLKHNYQG